MKINSILASFGIFMLCVITNLSLNAQSKNPNNHDDFDFKVIQNSTKYNFEKEHIHLLMLKNDSNKESSFELSSKVFEVIDNAEKNSSNVIVEIFNESLNENLTKITLAPNESFNIKVRISHSTNAKLNSMNICRITANQINNSDKKYVDINTFISNAQLSGD